MDVALRPPRSQLKRHEALCVMVSWNVRDKRDPNLWVWADGMIEWCPTNEELKRIEEAMKQAKG